MKRVLQLISFGEFTRLIVCIFLDVIEYFVPVLMTPVIGDILDAAGLIYCIYAFRGIGVVAVLELVPMLDPLPINLVTWGIWLYRRRIPRNKATLQS